MSTWTAPPRPGGRRRARLTPVVVVAALLVLAVAVVIQFPWAAAKLVAPAPAPYVDELPPAPEPVGPANDTCSEPDPGNPQGCLTPAAANYRQQVQVAFGDQQMSCWSEHAWNPASDHSDGRACDVFPGAGGRLPSTEEEIHGWHVAEWSRRYAEELDVSYIIWWGRIWTHDRPWRGWQPYDGGGVYDVDDPTGGHYDHVHVSFR